MRLILIFIFAWLCNSSYSQIIGGDIYNSGRMLIADALFSIESSKEGIAYYDISVDITGKVTSATFLTEKSTISSTPMKMDAKNLVMNLQFEKGNGFPKYHHGIVKVVFILKK